MTTRFSPTRADVERYRLLRALSTELNHRMIKTIPRQAYYDVGDAIGILHSGVLTFDSEDESSVLMDCCLYDWFEDGKNLVQRYAETHPAAPGSDEAYLLNAYLQARYRLLVVQSVAPGGGVHCQDILNGGELFLMDLGFARTAHAGAAFASRTIPLGEYSMTGGAGLPVHATGAVRNAFRRAEAIMDGRLESPGGIALCLVRACLAAGAANHIVYETAGENSPGASSRQSAPGRRAVGRNQPCPCGSGRKFKKCCGR